MANNNNPIKESSEQEPQKMKLDEQPGSMDQPQSKENIKGQPQANNEESNPEMKKDQPKEKTEGQSELKNASKGESGTSVQAAAQEQEQPEAKAEGQPETKEQDVSTGKGPKPIGPNQQTWDNPQPGEELKKEIDDQLTKLKKLGENPSGQDPAIDELNKKQDIESRNEGPEQEKKSENNTQDNFDPAKHKTEAPTH